MELPSFLQGREKLLLGLVAVVILAALYLFVLQPMFAQKEFRITVVGGSGERVDGALVEIFDGGKRVAQAVTKVGVAVFTNLPEKTLRVQGSKQGYDPANQTVDFRTRTTARLELGGGPEPETPTEGFSSINIKVAERTTKRPIAGATVRYAYESISGSKTTDSSGNTRFQAPSGVKIALHVSHPSYSFEAMTVLAQPKQVTVLLRKGAAAAALAAGSFGPRGSLVVTVVDENNKQVSRGTLRVLETSASALVQTASFQNGTATIMGLPLGAKLFLEADASGYLPYSSADTPFEMKENAISKVTLINESKGAPTTFVTLDTNNTPVEATVFVIPAGTIAPLKELKTTLAKNGSVSLNLALSKGYYAAAQAPGYILPSLSATFQAGAKITFKLEKANSTNSGHLGVKVVSEENKPLSGATLTIVTDDGFYITAGKSGTADSLFENLKANLKLKANGYYQGVSASAQVTVPAASSSLSESALISFATPTPTPKATTTPKPTVTPKPTNKASTTVTLLFELSTAFVDGQAVDALSGKPIPAILYAAPSGSKNFTSCSSTGEACLLRIKAGAPNSIIASADGYANTSATITLKAGERKSLTLKLVPAAFANETRAEFLGLFDSASGNPIEIVRPGGVYKARFRLFSLADVHEAGLVVRVGKSPALSGDGAGITSYSEADSVARSTTYNSGANCTDLDNNQPQEGQFKWVELSYKGGGVREVEIGVQISPLAPSGSNLTFFYRAWARFDQTYTRYPADTRFAGKESTTSLSGCYANSYELGFPIILSAGVEVSLGKDFTSSAAVKYNEVTGKVESSTEEFVLQIDPYLPADALPLNFASQEVLMTGINSTEGTQDCYHYDSTNKLLVFESKELNGKCPLAIVGGVAPSDESASVSFYYARNPTLQVTVPIKVKPASISSLSLTPQELTGDGTPRLVYLVNNLQRGSRTLLGQFEGDERDIVFSSPEVRPFSIRGDGEFRVLEKDASAASAIYTEENSYFPALSGQGSYLDGSCDTPECCSEFWCDSQQASTALSLFTRRVLSVADQTIFRRGNGQPFTYFNPAGIYGGRNPARLHLLLQAREGASLNSSAETDEGAPALTLPANFTLKYDSSLAGCPVEGPLVYDISAESTDGASWTLLLSVPKLSKNSYFGSQCGAGQEEGGTYGASSDLTLCSFLYGDGNDESACIKRVGHTITTSLEQASPDHSTPAFQSSGFDPANATETCAAASEAYATGTALLDSTCSRVSSAFQSCSEGPDALYQCTSANCRLQDATQDCGKNCETYSLEGSSVCTGAAITCSQVCTAAGTAAKTASNLGKTAVSEYAACMSAAATCPAAAEELGLTYVAASAQSTLEPTEAQILSTEEAKVAAAALEKSATEFETAKANALTAVAKAAAPCANPVDEADKGCCNVPVPCNKAATSNGAAAAAARKASTAAWNCVANQAILTAAATGGAIAPFSQDPTEAYMKGTRSRLQFQSGSCDVPIGDGTGAIVSASMALTSTTISAVLSKSSGTTASAIGCTISGTLCSTAVQAAAQVCQQQCTDKGTSCGDALTAAATAGGDCESTKGYLYEAPANGPGRAAWYTCYPYGTECRVACQPKDAIAQLIPWQSQLYLLERGGLTEDCQPLASDLLGLLQALPANLLLAQIADYSYSAPITNGFLGVQDSIMDPLSGTFEQGDTSRSEPVPEKGFEINPQTTDETTSYWEEKKHTEVFGGSSS